jgi:hypothetical protein
LDIQVVVFVETIYENKVDAHKEYIDTQWDSMYDLLQGPNKRDKRVPFLLS